MTKERRGKMKTVEAKVLIFLEADPGTLLR